MKFAPHLGDLISDPMTFTLRELGILKLQSLLLLLIFSYFSSFSESRKMERKISTNLPSKPS